MMQDDLEMVEIMAAFPDISKDLFLPTPDNKPTRTVNTGISGYPGIRQHRAKRRAKNSMASTSRKRNRG